MSSDACLENERPILLFTVNSIDSKLLGYMDLRITQILLFGDVYLDVNTNPSLLNPLSAGITLI